MKPIIRWINFLHIYQPPWQNPDTVAQVADESYRFLLAMFRRHRRFRATVNISGTLVETLQQQGHHDIIEGLQRLVETKQIELTGSSHFHAFLPELPADEIERQIVLHERIIRRIFGVTPRGFFLPEMAYSPSVGEAIAKRNYRWIILDPISAHDAPDPRVKHIDRRTGLTVIFRNRNLSKRYPPEELVRIVKSKKPQTIITATDGELYGHFHKDWQRHLEKIARSEEIESTTVGEYLASLRTAEPIRLRSASWETREHNILSNNPFTIWYNKNNIIHTKLWRLAHTAIAAVRRLPRDPHYSWARYHLDRGLASCSFWWASEVKTSPFAPVAWNPDEILNGATEMIKSIRSLDRLPGDEKIRAEKLFAELSEYIWIKHWKRHAR